VHGKNVRISKDAYGLVCAKFNSSCSIATGELGYSIGSCLQVRVGTRLMTHGTSDPLRPQLSTPACIAVLNE
jgi:hypothetical protein